MWKQRFSCSLAFVRHNSFSFSRVTIDDSLSPSLSSSSSSLSLSSIYHVPPSLSLPPYPLYLSYIYILHISFSLSLPSLMSLSPIQAITIDINVRYILLVSRTNTNCYFSSLAFVCVIARKNSQPFVCLFFLFPSVSRRIKPNPLSLFRFRGKNARFEFVT